LAWRKKNTINNLINDDDEWVEGTESLKPLVSNNIANLFTSEVLVTDLTVLEKILPKFT
jgi:hypothetical protein